LISEPTIHPLPLPIPNSAGVRTSRPRALAIASTLLNLSTPSPSPRLAQTGPAPYLHTTASGQVSIVLEPSKGKRRQVQGRSDWIVILEFEAPVEQGGDRHFRKVRSPSNCHIPIQSRGRQLISGPTIITEMSTFHYSIPNNPTVLWT
jgi:hypothetical protein